MHLLLVYLLSRVKKLVRENHAFDFLALTVNISKTVADTAKVTISD